MSPVCKHTDDLSGCRSLLSMAIFNSSQPPIRAPDVILEPESSWSASILSATDIVPSKLTWTIRTPFFSQNSTVLHYSLPKRTDTVVLYHQGHGGHSCDPFVEGRAWPFLAAGLDVLELFMPLKTCNVIASRDIAALKGRHDFYRRWHNAGSSTSEKPTLRFFIEPVVLAAAYAQSSALSYRHVALVGLSGGGWTIAAAASLLPNVKLTVAVAGLCRDPALQNAMTAYHYEESALQELADQRVLYMLAAREKGRAMLQVYHEREIASICPANRLGWSHIRNLDALVEARTRGHMHSAVTNESEHSFHLSDAAITLRAIELLRRDALTSESLNHLPCDMLSSDFSTSGAAAGLWEEQCLRMTKPPVNLTWSTTVDGLVPVRGTRGFRAPFYESV